MTEANHKAVAAVIGDVITERDQLRAEVDRLAVALAGVREALSNHPEPCPVAGESCGWRSAVTDARAALAKADRAGAER